MEANPSRDTAYTDFPNIEVVCYQSEGSALANREQAMLFKQLCMLGDPRYKCVCDETNPVAMLTSPGSEDRLVVHTLLPLTQILPGEHNFPLWQLEQVFPSNMIKEPSYNAVLLLLYMYRIWTTSAGNCEYMHLPKNRVTDDLIRKLISSNEHVIFGHVSQHCDTSRITRIDRIDKQTHWSNGQLKFTPESSLNVKPRQHGTEFETCFEQNLTVPLGPWILYRQLCRLWDKLLIWARLKSQLTGQNALVLAPLVLHIPAKSQEFVPTKQTNMVGAHIVVQCLSSEMSSVSLNTHQGVYVLTYPIFEKVPESEVVSRRLYQGDEAHLRAVNDKFKDLCSTLALQLQEDKMTVSRVDLYDVLQYHDTSFCYMVRCMQQTGLLNLDKDSSLQCVTLFYTNSMSRIVVSPHDRLNPGILSCLIEKLVASGYSALYKALASDNDFPYFHLPSDTSPLNDIYWFKDQLVHAISNNSRQQDPITYKLTDNFTFQIGPYQPSWVNTNDKIIYYQLDVSSTVPRLSELFPKDTEQRPLPDVMIQPTVVKSDHYSLLIFAPRQTCYIESLYTLAIHLLKCQYPSVTIRIAYNPVRKKKPVSTANSLTFAFASYLHKTHSSMLFTHNKQTRANI